MFSSALTPGGHVMAGHLLSPSVLSPFMKASPRFIEQLMDSHTSGIDTDMGHDIGFGRDDDMMRRGMCVDRSNGGSALRDGGLPSEQFSSTRVLSFSYEDTPRQARAAVLSIGGGSVLPASSMIGDLHPSVPSLFTLPRATFTSSTKAAAATAGSAPLKPPVSIPHQAFTPLSPPRLRGASHIPVNGCAVGDIASKCGSSGVDDDSNSEGNSKDDEESSEDDDDGDDDDGDDDASDDDFGTTKKKPAAASRTADGVVSRKRAKTEDKNASGNLAPGTILVSVVCDESSFRSPPSLRRVPPNSIHATTGTEDTPAAQARRTTNPCNCKKSKCLKLCVLSSHSLHCIRCTHLHYCAPLARLSDSLCMSIAATLVH
jgi:hypothetical protein